MSYTVCREAGCKMIGMAQPPNQKCRECQKENVEQKEG